MCRILVTGGAGLREPYMYSFIRKNYKIVVVDSFINSKAESQKELLKYVICMMIINKEI